MQRSYSSTGRISIWFVLLISLLLMNSICEAMYAQKTKSALKKKADFISQDDREFEKIKQLKVKTRIKLMAGYESYDKIPTKLKEVLKEMFDRNGNRTQWYERNAVGVIVSSCNIVYDKKNNPSKIEVFKKERKESMQTSKYDSKGNEIERIFLLADRKNNLQEMKTVFVYDNENNLVETKIYEEKVLSEIRTTKFENGIKGESIIKNPANDTIYTAVPEYNPEGKLVKEIKQNNKVKMTITYKYDTDGNLIEMIDNEVKRTFAYDDKHNLIQNEIFLLDGRRQFKMRYTYDRNGLQNEAIRYDNFENPNVYTKFKYEYYK